MAHSQRTAELSRKLCKQLGLNEKTTDLVYYAGLLQNIGKITLPESLFTNKGKLSKEEWEKLQIKLISLNTNQKEAREQITSSVLQEYERKLR